MITPGAYIRDIFTKPLGEQVTAHGWVKTRRDSKDIHFIQLNDGSTFQDLQVVIESGVIPESALNLATTGACVRVSGELIASPGSGQSVELKARELEVYGPADPATYPLQKKGHTMEFLREIAHLRVRSNTFGAVFRVRNALCFAIHKFFQERGFQYVNTPLITTSDAEGAGAMFRVTTLPPGQINDAEDFFGRPAYLAVSGQLEAEIFALSFTNVYTFGPTFRAENSNTPRHLAEFWMIEPEMAFFDLTDNMALAEAFLKRIVKDVLADCPEDMRFLEERIDKKVFTRLQTILDKQFLRVSYSDAIDLLLQAGVAQQKWEFPVAWGSDLQAEHEKYLTEQHFKSPIILFDYPRTLKPFYMRVNDAGRTVLAMDVLVPG